LRGTAFNEAERKMVDMMMLLVLAVWVLLPLAPAILMFRLVPGNAITLTGPLANLTLNASGAIAAYFAVFVFISFFIGDMRGDIKKRNEVKQSWQVVADIELVDATGNRIDLEGNRAKFQEYANALKVAPTPPIYGIDHNTAALWIKVVEGEYGLPSIRVDIDKFGLGIIKLTKGASDFEFLPGNIIKLKKPLKVHQDPDLVPKLDRQPETISRSSASP
jgi:hypothetical protein